MKFVIEVFKQWVKKLNFFSILFENKIKFYFFQKDAEMRRKFKDGAKLNCNIFLIFMFAFCFQSFNMIFSKIQKKINEKKKSKTSYSWRKKYRKNSIIKKIATKII